MPTYSLPRRAASNPFLVSRAVSSNLCNYNYNSTLAISNNVYNGPLSKHCSYDTYCFHTQVSLKHFPHVGYKILKNKTPDWFNVFYSIFFNKYGADVWTDLWIILLLTEFSKFMYCLRQDKFVCEI